MNKIVKVLAKLNINNIPTTDNILLHKLNHPMYVCYIKAAGNSIRGIILVCNKQPILLASGAFIEEAL